MPPRSPLAPERFPALPPVAGVRIGAIAAELRYKGRPDLTMAAFDNGTTVAGVFTRSRTASPPVLWCRKILKSGRARGLVVNAGNANTYTGRQGAGHVRETAAVAARLIGAKAEDVHVSSTGVIGQPLPIEKLTAALPGLHATIGTDGFALAAQAIMTTDTFPKGAHRTATIAGRPVTLVGIAKGSGMIAPDMATMLAYVFTDANLPAAVLQACLRRATERSFNRITVDGDTSTSDTLLLFATGKAARRPQADGAGDPALRDFRAALDDLCVDLAQQIVRDGEGAEKFITISVGGAESARAARQIALTIANSPLVKTAIAGSDANWGRIVAAVGRAGEKVNPARMVIRFGDQIATRGDGLEPGYDEGRATAHVRGRAVTIGVDVGVGRGAAEVWTCDLTHGYIDINGSYRS
jgi:glutamate N-acetyltransferase/amino-acid N-acetyltransferase